ncbi:1-phosphofructokinase [Lactobacillus sp. ESL0679]|uniref:1-phosphofructokinase n=1 Tax=Lactobacillus sp. ESL0679 TaxID=2983209 RepID=UPI0023F7E223|nr:1-phosphofructokinase [Lactobacillus sp. ESL0679]MDF7682244.1 1-phosphofructokinase [Lactobacillus sp. ESL0679]
MIYTVTVNPALDYVMQLKEVTPGAVNRTPSAVFLAGGKGINVSQILNQLGIENTAWGFAGGFTGKELVHQLNRRRIVNDFVTIKQVTRVNVKVHAGQETEINAAGPAIAPAEVAAFGDRLSDLQAGDLVVLSGSLAANLPEDFYQKLLPLIKKAGAEFVIDTTGQALLDTLSYKPLVIKPNHHELADLFNTTFNSEQEMLTCAHQLLDKGAQNVMVSMAAKGGYLITPEHVYHAPAAVGTAVNSVGAGDSMIAGFVGTYVKSGNPKESFRVGMACGAATAFTKDIAVKSQIDAVLPQIEVEQIS